MFQGPTVYSDNCIVQKGSLSERRVVVLVISAWLASRTAKLYKKNHLISGRPCRKQACQDALASGQGLLSSHAMCLRPQGLIGCTCKEFEEMESSIPCYIPGRQYLSGLRLL